MKHPITAVPLSALAVALLSWTGTAPASTPHRDQDPARDFLYQPATGLVAAVRQAVTKYRNLSAAEADGYVPVFGCVSSPDEGAMGAHYLRPDLLGDGAEDASHPELLVYEPTWYGRMQLVAVEYFTLADNWDANHPDGSPPILMGQLFNYSGTPNRFRLPANYSLHVWAWKYNPKGVFAMWNPRVSCQYYNPPAA